MKRLIPKDKFDFTPFTTLMEINEDEVQLILLELLSWIADMNWPIADAMLGVLARFPDSMVPLIKELLKPTETDEDWKWSIIVGLMPILPPKSQILLRDSIKRIIDSPSDGEVYGGVWEVAKNYMQKHDR
ncbi:MAG: DUF5071 domain-containing protein [Defluviitaleaceae bacterium]|nr:DUF5071 domain-containing protein [Defluviitaleaceae bacterium]